MEGITVAPAAINGLHLAQPNTTVVFEEGAEVPEHSGLGSLFITESVLAWWNQETGKGFEVQYPAIVLHAISRDTSNFPHPCLYCQLELNGEEEPPYEVRLCPEDPSALDAMFKAMSACQELHPDPNDDDSGDEGGSGMLMDAMFGGNVGGSENGSGEAAVSGMRGVDGYYDSEDEIEMTEPGQATIDRLSNLLITDGVPPPAAGGSVAEDEDGRFGDAD